MNRLKGNWQIFGIIVVIAVIIAPGVVGHIARINPTIPVFVQVTPTSPFLSAIIVADANGTVLACGDTDAGFQPILRGDMNVSFTDRNGTFYYSDYCSDSNTLIEFACGGDVRVNGMAPVPDIVYVFKFNCQDINKTCSLGRCV